MEILIAVSVVALVLLLLVGGTAFIVAKFYRKVDQGQALIINKMRADPDVTFTGGVVYPIIHRSEVMDISVKSILISRAGKDGLICEDNIRADIKVAFFVRVNKTTEDVLRVAQSIGCTRASDQDTLEELFAAKFSEALKTVGKKKQFEQLYTERDDFKDSIINIIGRDLNGYFLEDVAIDYLEQTPIESLDKDNILDARGIRKIVRITATEHTETNDLRQNERMELTRQNLQADEAILELERRRADAEAKQKREIATVKAREDAEISKVQSEEHQRSEMARIAAAEEISIGELNMTRQVEVAEKDKQRVVAIKSEQVQRDRELEVIAREREVERQEIDKEMELEIKRKEIAEVVRGRIVVDKNVAEEEERIKDLRATAEATRGKDVLVIAAEGQAQESLVKEIKGAEAAEKVAEFRAREQLTLANADLEAAERVAKAKIRMSEGIQAEVAAQGLAEVKVKEANAVALEKEGLAQARVRLETMQAEAKGSEEQGMAKMRIRERAIELEAQLQREKMVAQADGKKAEAEAIQLTGRAEADAVQAKLSAEAQGKQAMAEATKAELLAEAAGEEAKAKVIEVAGLAEARSIEERMRAEATGLREKLEAMKAMEGAAREHEEFRIKLEHDETIHLASLEVQTTMAVEQAKVLAEAFGKADIQIMGGDGQFFERFVQAASVGNAIDGLMGNSKVLQGALAPYTTGDKTITDGVKDVIDAMGPAVATGVAASTVLAGLLSKAGSDDEKSRLQSLLDEAKKLGL